MWIWIIKGLDTHCFCNRGGYTNRRLWHILIISGPRQLRQENCKCKVSLGYIMRHCLIKQNKTNPLKPNGQPTNEPTNPPTNEWTNEQTNQYSKEKRKEKKKKLITLSLRTRQLLCYLNDYLIMFVFILRIISLYSVIFTYYKKSWFFFKKT